MLKAEKFEDFFGHDEDAIRNAAVLLVEAKSAFDSGDITKSEFDELAEDILEIGEIDKLADNLDRRVAFKQALEGLKSLAGILGKII